MRVVDPYSPLGRWWRRQRLESRLRQNLLVTVFLVLAAGAGWYVAVMLTPSDAEGSSLAYYEITTEHRVTVRDTRTSKPRVKLVKSVRRVYVDPETVRSTRVITTPGGVQTVSVVGPSVLRTIPVTRERVITRAGRRITVAETVAVTRADVRTEVLTEVQTDVRTDTLTERETQTRRETTTQRETVTERESITITEPVTVTMIEPVEVTVTVEVPITVRVTITEEATPTEP
jgi:hypothetical protein